MADLVYKKPELYKGGDLQGTWNVTLKIDGVRAIRNPEWVEGSDLPKYVSRKNKPLYNLDHLEFQDAEIFNTDWETTVSMVRTHNAEPVDATYVHELGVDYDPRLNWGDIENPTAEQISELLERALSLKMEGLVLRNSRGKWYKVKPIETYDVLVTGYQAGAGKHLGRLGALITPMGKIGTGFDDATREYFHDLHMEGLLINQVTVEVDCMSLTKNGKFRHARYIRERFDKGVES